MHILYDLKELNNENHLTLTPQVLIIQGNEKSLDKGLDYPVRSSRRREYLLSFFKG